MGLDLLLAVVIVVLLFGALLSVVTKTSFTADTDPGKSSGRVLYDLPREVTHESSVPSKPPILPGVTWKRLFLASMCAGMGFAVGLMVLIGLGMLIMLIAD
jgi:hypothetical protein